MYNKLQDATLTIKSSTLEGKFMYCNPCNLQKLCLGNDKKLKTNGQSVYNYKHRIIYRGQHKLKTGYKK